MYKFHNPTNNRYYYITIQPDMFNEHAIVVYRGGRSNVIVKYGYASEVEMKDALQRIITRRIQRGYIMIAK